MQQWFEKDKHNITSSIHSPKEIISDKLKLPKTMIVLKTFTVEAESIPGQYICVSGNCSSLGNWEVNEAFVLTNTNLSHKKNNCIYNIWSGVAHLPADKEICFRYFTAYIVEPDIEHEYTKQKHIFVYSWESHFESRTHNGNQLLNSNDDTKKCDIYGLVNGKQQISKGFLTTECAIQFKLFDNPIIFWAPRLQRKIKSISIKLTPVPLTKLTTDSGDDSPNNYFFDDSNHLIDENQKHSGWPFVECMNIPDDNNFQFQNQFGSMIKENTFHIFQTKNQNFGYVGYLFDIYIHKESSDEPPYHIGFTHILPGNMKYSNGVVMSPITSVTHKPIGELKIDYLIIKPTKDIHCNLEKIKTIDWKSSYTPLDIGHRGSGSSFKQILSDCSHIRENTIASLKEAANKGADLVEFDVQLTKDLVPVIYHDFVVSMATKSKTDILASDVERIKIPLKDFSFYQLQTLKLYHVNEPHSLSENYFLSDVGNDYQPFPKLEKAFTDVDTDVGFNVELKWTMKLQDDTYELDNPFDMNLFVDIILKTTFEFAGSRSIIFSCFHPDICTLVKMKQNRYPVLFLTQGVTKRYPSYADPRCHTIQSAVYFSSSHDLLGVNVHSEDLLRDHTQIKIVKEAGLALFCWGDDNNCQEVANKFKQLGVDAVIYDKLDRNYLLKKKQNCSKKESEVFIAENYCDQTGIILSTNQSHKENAHMREDNDREGDNNKYFMDISKASFQNHCSSTDTLWDEKQSSSNDFKRYFDLDQSCTNTDGKSSISKKSKSDAQ